MLQKNKFLLYLFSIVIIAAILRLYHLSSLPPSINRDEAALGYNAYSILKTGADEHGVFLPISLQSFGDWKLPGYSYLSVIPIALFGLNEFSTRIISALAGIIGVIFVYFIVLKLFKQKSTALFAAVFFALSPWSIYFSRAAYEVNVATTFFLGGLLCFLLFIENQKKVTSLIFASILWGLTLFIYYSYILFIPLFITGMMISYRKQVKNKFGIALPIAIFFVFLLGSFIATSAGGNKVSTLSIFNDPNVLYNRVEKIRGDGAQENPFVQHLLHNKYEGATYQLLQNYLLAFSPTFLFDKGGEKLVHNLGTFGNLYLFDALLLVIGLATLFWQRSKVLPLILLWLVLGPIPSSLTKDTPNSTRLFLLMPVLIIISACGANAIWNYFHRHTFTNITAKILLSLLFIVNVTYFLDLYFVHFTIERARFWDYGVKQAVELTNHYPGEGVYYRGSENFPYIFFLFYNKYDPLQFRKEVSYYPLTSEGFLYVMGFGRYHFPKTIDYAQIYPKSIYIDDTRTGDKQHAILLPSGEPILGYYITK